MQDSLSNRREHGVRPSCETQKKVLPLTSPEGTYRPSLTCSARLYRSDLLAFTQLRLSVLLMFWLWKSHLIRLICCGGYHTYSLNLRGTLQYDQYENTTKLLACAFFFFSFSSPLPCLAARRKIVCFVGQPMMDKPRGDPFLSSTHFPRIAQAGSG